MSKLAVKVFLAYLALCLIWGSTWIAIRVGLESLTPLFSAGLRFSLASIMIFVLMKIKSIPLQTDKVSIRLYLLMGFFSFVIPFGLVYWAEQFVPSGMAAVLFAVYPFLVVIFSFIRLPSESIGFYKIFGTILGFVGIVIIFSDSFEGDLTNYLIGMFAVVLSGIMQAWIAVSIKKFGNHLHSLSMNFIPMVIAGISMIVIAFFAEDLSTIRMDENAVLSILYLAFFGSVITFTTFYWLIKRINLVILSLIAFITPIVALILGFFFYNEVLSARHFIGAAMVLTGVFWANLGNLLKLRKGSIIKVKTE
ncbi:MAG: EamA family transporter [Ignavibacteriaceae bacterium]|jgi:drug/metabolite transporter (DMT)-like permease|nr:EamA family transporter [Ignavibacteriaceae bacterium]